MWQCKRPLHCKAKLVEVTGLRSDVSQFLNSDKRNKMVLTNNQKAVIENDFNEKGWSAYKIWKEHPSFECSRMPVHNLIKKIQETRLTEHNKGSNRLVTATTEENLSIFEEIICIVTHIHQANCTSDINQQVISSSLGQEKESSLLQTFKNTSHEFSMP